jgi:multidrug efflux system outer membrane protein
VRRFGSVLAALSLASCSLASAYVRPAAPVPVSWPAGDAYLQQSEISLPTVTYTDVFRDPRLQTLIAQALVNNRDLRVAAANIAEARAQVRVARAAQFPSIGASGSANARVDGNGDVTQSYSLSGGVSSFEVDLFGRLRNATQAERERELSTEASARTVRLGLIADLASVWASYAADRDLLAIAEDTAANATRAVQLTRLRLEGGIAPRTDLRQAEQVLATAQGDVAEQTTALAQDENLIRLLVGGQVDHSLLPGGLPEVVASIAMLPAGLSSEVLLRRPDVVQAEYLLRAANANIGVARAALFPRISLTGLLGLASDALGSLISAGAFSATGGAGTSYTIFDFGGRRAQVAVSQAQRDEALASYERAIQRAFREVADALAVQGTIGERLRAADANTAAATDTARLEEARYRGGIDSFLANLDAQRSLYNARRGQTAVELAAVNNRVTLYRVLAADTAAATSADGTSPPPGDR